MSDEKGLRRIPKNLRIALLATVIFLAVAGIVYGVLVYIRTGSSTVNVYAVENFMITGSGLGQSETQGNVYADRIQSVMVSGTQIVKEVFVSEGDSVKEGDPLLSYDTTLSDIELERQEIKVGQLELELKQAEADLKEINTYKVGSPISVNPDSPVLVADERTDVTYRCGYGTEASPYVFIWSGNRAVDYSFVSEATGWMATQVSPEGEETTESVSTVYAVFETREGNSMQGSVTYSIMFIITDKGDGSISVKYASPSGDYSPENPAEPEVPVDTATYVSSYAELKELKETAAAKIKTLQLDLKKAQLKYKELEYELSSGIVYSKLDGVVKTVNDPEEVSGTDQPALVVSGGGGYYVTGYLSENELSSVHVGDSVGIMSWESYQSGEAVITAISEYPVDNTSGSYYHYGTGNSNSSLYPFTAAIGEDMAVREGEYLYITYSPGSDEGSGFYIDSMFVRTEGGQSYVYAEGSDGRLERRNIKTGGTLYGSYTEILSGLESGDYIAFPYGRKVKQGVKTGRASADMLYIS